MSSLLTTGANGGLGFELVRQALAQPESSISKVLAVTRKPSDRIAELVSSSKGRLFNIVISDITSEESIGKALPDIEKALGGAGLDILVNMAGTATVDPDGIASMTAKSLDGDFATNVGSVQAMTVTLLPLLKQGNNKEVVNISTGLGSISTADQFGFFPVTAYKVSRAAVNMLTRLWAASYKDEGFIFFNISPGWVRTVEANKDAHLSPEQSINSVLDLVLTADKTTNGRFRNIKVAGFEEGLIRYDGKDIDW